MNISKPEWVQLAGDQRTCVMNTLSGSFVRSEVYEDFRDREEVSVVMAFQPNCWYDKEKDIWVGPSDIAQVQPSPPKSTE